MKTVWQTRNHAEQRSETRGGILACGIFLATIAAAFSQSAANSFPNCKMILASGCSHSEKVACGNNVYARLHGGRIQTSTDNHSWTDRPLVTPTFLRDVTYGNGLFVAVGGSYFDVPGVIVTSGDGITWIRRNLRNESNLYGVTFGKGLFVAVGDAGAIYTSLDGIAWKRQRSENPPMLLATIASGNGVFVAGGEAGAILTSTNGIRWTAANLNAPVYVGTIHFHDDTFIVKGRGSSFTSANGLTWHRRNTETAVIQPFASTEGTQK